MTNIDYKLAKEIGATHYWGRKYWRSGKNNCAAQYTACRWVDVGQSSDPNGKYKGFWDDCKIDFSKAEAQESTDWDGTGVPPVDTVCELHNDHGYDLNYMEDIIGQNVTVRAVFESGESKIKMAAVEDQNGLCGCFRVSMLRPIRPKEEIEREKAIERMAKIMLDTGEHTINDITLGALYDAGYRLQEGEG